MDNRERARTRHENATETNFVGSKKKIHSGGEKMRNASGHQGENEWQGKQKWTETHTASPS